MSLSALEGVLVLAALLAGATGSWSPCGFSMIATIGPAGHTGGLRTTFAAAASFSLGALAGGLATFGSLAAVGAWLHTRGAAIAAAAAIALALAAALGEARGARIVPQVRRQVPERWRRALPLPIAAGLYGVLLGLGFTTFVLTFAVWALAGVSFALGDSALGALVGVVFGLGRALPVVALAPLADRPAGERAVALMAERPAILRGLRLAGSLALVLAALAIATHADDATAATRVDLVARDGSDPSVAGTTLAWRAEGGRIELRDVGAAPRALEGADPALGGPYLAIRSGARIAILDRATLAQVTAFEAPDADALAVSEQWLAYRARRAGRDRLVVQPLAPTGAARVIASVPAPAQLGRPALDGDRLAYHVAGRSGSRIQALDLATGARRTLRSGSSGVAVSDPSISGRTLLHVRTSARSQRLVLGERLSSGSDRTLYAVAATSRRDRGYEPGRRPQRRLAPIPVPPRPGTQGELVTLWSTALSERFAYVTRLRTRGGATRAELVRVPR